VGKHFEWFVITSWSLREFRCEINSYLLFCYGFSFNVFDLLVILYFVLAALIVQIVTLKSGIKAVLTRTDGIKVVLSEILVSRSFASKINFDYWEFKWCLFFHIMISLPMPSWNLVQGGASLDLSQISLPILKTIKLIFLRIVCWPLRLKICLEILYFMKIISCWYFGMKNLWTFGKMSVGDQDT